MTGHRQPFAAEPTAAGTQSLVPGVVPIAPGDRLRWRSEAPLAPSKPQRASDLGLFDLNARRQLDLFASPNPKVPGS